MINTVLGAIPGDELGPTLMHEHISWDRDGADSVRSYSIDEVVGTMLPYLLELRSFGCRTLVEATPSGAGRDLEILRRCSARSGIHIITNSGAWDGGDNAGKAVPGYIKTSSTDEISDGWSSEFFNGFGDTGVKPGFIKIALGDTGEVTALQEKLLRAAVRASIRTALPLQCHAAVADSARRAFQIIEEENLDYNKFIWVHADTAGDFQLTKTMVGKGMWVEYDYLARVTDIEGYTELVKKTLDAGLADRLLLAHDAGSFYYGEKNDESTIYPFARIFKEFIPFWRKNGISQATIDKLLTENPKKVLDI